MAFNISMVSLLIGSVDVSPAGAHEYQVLTKSTRSAI